MWYSLAKPQGRIITRQYGTANFHFPQRLNITPKRLAQVVWAENEKLVCREMKWGFDASRRFNPLVSNVKFESLLKPRFRHIYSSYRCLVPATEFDYRDEPHKGTRLVHPFPVDGRPFFFAGLWSDKNAKQEFVIITVPAMDGIHRGSRIPFIVAEADYEAWLNPQSHDYLSVFPSVNSLKCILVNARE
jgi:putative SOS response-associated peptidase YedK